ncbi:MAG: glycoside hydrolase family 99-like domain-containing protein [Prevotella sp.]|nr:glycoside hydrolase family 99-like domain-containing protein [Prevotella sp.]
MSNKARVIAFYLPQFHPIPENDEWWGKGFTEWTNVGKAKPLFKGHYQPRVPADLGYYDLRLPIVREQQAEMAREAGVEGFCYWHYWFGNGRTLLSEIFDEVLESGKPDFPFCLGWANHSWTRRTWNSSAAMHKDLDLLLQEYPGDKDYENHFYNVLPAFRDKRYITVDGKPIFVIYAPMDIPDIRNFTNLWRSLAVKNGLQGIHFVGRANNKINEFVPLLDDVLDALTFESFMNAHHRVNGYVKSKINYELRKFFPWVAPLNKFKYKDIIRNWFTEYDRLENCYPSILPNWDRSPRGGRTTMIYTGSTPELFKTHVEEALDIIRDKQPEHRILFLKSWNEWAEGNYMEPDLKFGHGYLDALRDVIVG